MRVSFISVKKGDNGSPIKQLCEDFLTDSSRKDMPQPMLLEGGQGINYVVCVSIIDKDEIERICNKNMYTLQDFSIISSEVDDNTFNLSYRVTMRYFEDPMYSLEK